MVCSFLAFQCPYKIASILTNCCQCVSPIKDQKMKVQAAIQGDQVRVTGKKRDDLQAVIALLEKSEIGIPLQFGNFRD